MSHAGTTPATPRLYLLDVEGTVAPLTLTSEVLYPYARRHMPFFIEMFVSDPAVRADLSLLAEERQTEPSPEAPSFVPPDDELGLENSVVAAVNYLLWLMGRDRKSTALKSIQGKIWKRGFESGQLKGALFDDVPPAFARWSQQARVAIYSSGSTEAQQLVFRHSTHGDLTPLIAGYFDTRTGAKADPASYAAIADAMQAGPGEVLFFSDVLRELDAASEAGCQTRLVIRPGNPPAAGIHSHTAVESFASL